jgi:DNA-binding transcriptional MerR regulator
MSVKGKKGKTRKRMTISELAAEFGITPRAIRYYEELGLISPYRETPTSQRLYDERARTRLKLILRGKRFGFSLAETREILELYDVDPTQRRQICRTLEYGLNHIQEIEEMIQELCEIRQEMMEFAWHFLEILEQGDDSQDPDMKGFIQDYRKSLMSLEKKA